MRKGRNRRETLQELSEEFVKLHTRKEDQYWRVRMGLGTDAESEAADLAHREAEWNRFTQDPDKLKLLRELEAEPGPRTEMDQLQGWIALFSAHVIEDSGARKFSQELVKKEHLLGAARARMPLGLRNPESGELVRASSVRLDLMTRTNADEKVRRAAYEGLKSVEDYVIDNGFLELVGIRNRLARALGYEDFYAWRVAVVEKTSKEHIFGLLDRLEEGTRKPNQALLDSLQADIGVQALEPWNFQYLFQGPLIKKLDPYFPLAGALERWGRSYHALGIKYRGAKLTLDLLDRPGKFENGFMHGPGVAYSDQGSWQPARVNFTANAVVGQPGGGQEALAVLFHEGGHAAHMSNVYQDAPCFSSEYAPTSIAYAETQSMFLESMVRDPEWWVRYAHNEEGEAMPRELWMEGQAKGSAFRSWMLRWMLTVPYAERFLYELPDEERTRDRVLEEFRKIEKKLQGLNAGTRPLLSVPHFLAGESSAYFHAYVLAEMAVHQTREHFLKQDGQLTDNKRIGPALTLHYWRPGNSIGYEDTLRSLMGTGLSPEALIREANLSPEESAKEAEARMAKLEAQPPSIAPVDLEAEVHVVHGPEKVTSTENQSFEAACSEFADWVHGLERQTRLPGT